MSAGDARHGRRDNGLVAAEYAAAADLDPRVGEHMLDVLALDGIAAYLRPSSDTNPITRSSHLPGRPTDRLFVDRAHLATARRYLARLAEEPAAPTQATSEPDMDAAWEQIVAGFNAEAAGSRPGWPDTEELGGRPTSGRPGRGTYATASPAQDDEPSLLDGLDTFGANLPDADEGDYTPPTPPPVPRPSPPVALAVVGVVGGMVVFIRPDLLPVSQGVAMFLGFAAFVGGVVTLVRRLRPGNPDEDDSDDGARV